MLQKILLAIGDSPDSERVFAAGLTLAEKLGAEMLILHVLDPLVPHNLSKSFSCMFFAILIMLATESPSPNKVHGVKHNC